MYNCHEIKNAVTSLKHCFKCEITVWVDKKILFTTHDQEKYTIENQTLMKEIDKFDSPVLIFSPRNHQFCNHCTQLNNCQLILELFFPFTEKNGGINMQFGEPAREILASMTINYLVQLLKNYAMYINLLLDREIDLKQNILLTQQINYLSNIVPEGVVFYDQHKKIIGINSSAKQLHLPELLADHKIGHSSLRSQITIAHPKRDITVRGKSFFYNKEFAGALIHTIQPLQKETYVSKLQEQTVISGIISKDQALLKVLDIVQQVAQSDSTILIRGESGTGKEVIAQAIHELSNRPTAPFIAINCAAIPEHLLESELFGYEEGAFTGAKKGGKLGKIELANYGTLFLDEVGDMPLALQAKLLRVIQEKSIDRIGGTKPFPINIRLVTATNRNLEEMIKEGSFREDLFFRLNVIPIHLPPLRERPGDIELLLNYFIKKYCVMLNKDFKIFSYAAMRQVLSYQWPGNVRELENMIEYLVNIHEQDIITPEDLPIKFNHTSEVTNTKSQRLFNSKETVVNNHRHIPKGKQIKEEIINLLNTHGWHTEGKKRAAANLGISLATLYRWIKKYNIKE